MLLELNFEMRELSDEALFGAWNKTGIFGLLWPLLLLLLFDVVDVLLSFGKTRSFVKLRFVYTAGLFFVLLLAAYSAKWNEKFLFIAFTGWLDANCLFKECLTKYFWLYLYLNSKLKIKLNKSNNNYTCSLTGYFLTKNEFLFSFIVELLNSEMLSLLLLFIDCLLILPMLFNLL